MKLNGIHHITAITGDAQRNVDFYTRVLGLRLVAKTVNQDDPSAYHLFYADEEGSPGTDLTFFEYPGAMPGPAGAGMVHRVVWRVASPEAFDFWAERLAAEGIAVRAGGATVSSSPSPRDWSTSWSWTRPAIRPLSPRHPEIPADMALAGFAGCACTACARRQHPAAGGRARATHRPSRCGSCAATAAAAPSQLDAPPPERGIPGAGTVHHVAFCAPAAEHPQWPDVLLAVPALQPTPVIDRHYFHSIYFREPGGVLYELADTGRGSPSTSRSTAGRQGDPAAVAGAAAGADRVASDADRRSARGLGDRLYRPTPRASRRRAQPPPARRCRKGGGARPGAAIGRRSPPGACRARSRPAGRHTAAAGGR